MIIDLYCLKCDESLIVVRDGVEAGDKVLECPNCHIEIIVSLSSELIKKGVRR